MFVQIFEGNTDDPQAVRDRVERWEREVRPGAIGYLGSTGGVTDDGRVVMLARFTDRAAAEANSARPEQSAWWAEVEQCFTGPVTFHETDDITEMRHGDAQQARFVQAMEGHVTDRVRAERLQDKMEPLLSSMRPDLLGTTTAYFDDGAYASLAYFSDEQEARRNEQASVPDAVAGQLAEWDRLLPVEEYIDLTRPVLIRA